MFCYANHSDAVGTLYQEACVRFVEARIASDEPTAQRWNAAAAAIKAAWPELVAKSLEKEIARDES